MSTKMGRTSDYKEDYNKQVEMLCKLGATDKEIAEALGVSERTINNWKASIPEFVQSIRTGKDYHDCELIEKSLKKRATGYDVTETKTEMDSERNVLRVTDQTKHIPSSDTSMALWLNNRSGGRFTRKQELDVSGEGISISMNFGDKGDKDE